MSDFVDFGLGEGDLKRLREAERLLSAPPAPLVPVRVIDPSRLPVNARHVTKAAA